jgi:hypothetical protein
MERPPSPKGELSGTPIVGKRSLEFVLLSKVQKVEVSDTTDDDRIATARNTNINSASK